MTKKTFPETIRTEVNIHERLKRMENCFNFCLADAPENFFNVTNFFDLIGMKVAFFPSERDLYHCSEKLNGLYLGGIETFIGQVTEVKIWNDLDNIKLDNEDEDPEPEKAIPSKITKQGIAFTKIITTFGEITKIWGEEWDDLEPDWTLETPDGTGYEYGNVIFKK